MTFFASLPGVIKNKCQELFKIKCPILNWNSCFEDADVRNGEYKAKFCDIGGPIRLFCRTAVFCRFEQKCVLYASANLELVDKFCYLSDMLSVDGDADAAVEIRIQIGWNKFRQLVPLLTNKDISLKVRARLYSSCVQSSILHGSETWPIRKENEVALRGQR